MKKNLSDFEAKIEELQKENNKLTQKVMQEADIKEKLMIENKTDKQAFALMKKEIEEVTLALDKMSSENQILKSQSLSK